MSNKKKTVVRWSPHDPSLFVVGAEDLRLYRKVYAEIPSPSDGAIETDTNQTHRRRKSNRLVDVNSNVPQLTCIEWYPSIEHSRLLAVGLGSGKVSLTNFQGETEGDEGVRGELTPMYSRPCNSVAWNIHNPNQIAVGLEKVRSDFCTLVWDVNYTSGNMSSSQGIRGTVSGSKKSRPESSSRRGLRSEPSAGSVRDRPHMPVHELANSEATMALSWVPTQPSCLAAGTGFKWFRMYDLRSAANAPLSVAAHSKAVYGVVFDYHRPHMVATYSDGPHEVVKVWDIRKLDASAQPVVTLQPSTKTLSEIAWSPYKAGVLATTSVEVRWISLWDTNKAEEGPVQISKPVKKRYTNEPIISFSWQNVSTSALASVSSKTAAVVAAFPNRLLTAGISGSVEDISLFDSMAFSLSSKGVLAFACGKLLFGGSTAPSIKNEHSLDISDEMIALVQKGYSNDVVKNIELLSALPHSPSESTWRTRQLLNLWMWIERAEKLRRNPSLLNVGDPSDAEEYTTKQLGGYAGRDFFSNVGVDWLLSSHSDDGPEKSYTISDSTVDRRLGCPVFEGPGRSLVMKVCGWDPNAPIRNLSTDARGARTGLRDKTSRASDDLSAILALCEQRGEHERAAALAVFHGDLNRAFATLHAGANAMEEIAQPIDYNASDNEEEDEEDDLLHHFDGLSKTSEAMRLVAMAIAGYSMAMVSESQVEGASTLWMESCRGLLKNPSIVKSNQTRYLHAICAFLYATSSSSSSSSSSSLASSVARPSSRRPGRQPSTNDVQETQLFSLILNDQSLPLSDRIAFACRYLPAKDLQSFVSERTATGEKRGSLEVLMLTGIGDRGISVLQTYLDNTADIQTVALLTARLSESQVSAKENLGRWLESYRQLLNGWQLWHERALFDVERSQLIKKFAKQESILKSKAPSNKDLSTTESTDDSLLAFSIPPQLYVRCNYCGASLALSSMLRQGTSHTGWLSRAKPKLTCCPSCRKSLPQCALCLLPFGSLNPYVELANRRARQQLDDMVTSNLTDFGDNLSELSNIPFVEWFTWCQTCRHGGHAHHMQEWFETHSTCPVSDCSCKCNELDSSLIKTRASKKLGIQFAQKHVKTAAKTFESLTIVP